MTFQILVIEDEKEMAKFVKLELECEGYEVTYAIDGLVGLTKIRQSYFDLILLDWQLPNVSGIEICRRLRQTKNYVPIIFLSARSTVSDRVTALNAGADDYLIKPFNIEELLARVWSKIRRTRTNKKRVIKFADLLLNFVEQKVYRGNRLIELTNIEFKLLEYLISHPNQVLTRQQIFESVWGDSFLDSSRCIEFHIRHLRQKLEATKEKRLIQTVRGIGYVLRD